MPFYTTFTDLDHGWRSQGRDKTRHLGFIFSHIFQLIRMKCDDEAVQVEHTDCTFFERDLMKQDKWLLFCLTAKKKPKTKQNKTKKL